MMTTQEIVGWICLNLMFSWDRRSASDLNLQFPVYVFGSSFEGTTTPGLKSDLDIIVEHELFPVVTNVSESQQFQQCRMLIQDHHTPPGYAKLQIVFDGVPQTASQFSISRSNHRVDTENRVVLSISDETRISGSAMHGPAITLGNPSQQPHDIVRAVRCKKWPDCASEWLTRTRRYNYPTRDQVNKCKDLGFFLVYVGHPNSQEKHLQWRISFSLQERLLVINFNAVQLMCYILAKMIKKEFIHKSLGEKSLSSYHFKTLMFYMIEETPAEFWVKHNLLYCLHHILKRMLVWVERGNCPNYFIPGENMFEGRISEQMQLQLCGLLRQLIDAKFKYLVTIATDGLGDKYQEALYPGLQPYRCPPYGNVRCAIEMYTCIGRAWAGCLLLFCRYSKNQHTNGTAEILCDLKARLLRIEQGTDHSVEEVRRVVSLFLPYVDIQLLSFQVVSAKRWSRSTAYIFNLITSEKWHALSLESDMFSSKLKQASLLCMLEYYEMSLEVLQTLENQVEQSVSICSCYTERQRDQLQLERRLMYFPACSYEQFLHRHLIPCVVFLPAERLLTPSALCYEMNRSACSPPESKEYWYDCAVVDGKVLLYYLLYLNHSRLGLDTNASVDTNNILWLIRTNRLLGHRETALNLLGWIYKERGLVDRAVERFEESLTIQSSHNAALVHLQDEDTYILNGEKLGGLVNHKLVKAP